jgi:hypothetical protein
VIVEYNLESKWEGGGGKEIFKRKLQSPEHEDKSVRDLDNNK